MVKHFFIFVALCVLSILLIPVLIDYSLGSLLVGGCDNLVFIIILLVIVLFVELAIVIVKGIFELTRKPDDDKDN